MGQVGTVISLQSYASGLTTGSAVDRIIGTKRSGPRGIESIIEYNGVFLNNRSWIDTFLVTRIDGIDDADVRDAREENPDDDGETLGRALYGGRTIVLQGEIQTKTIWKLRDMEQGLRQAFADISRERPLIFHHPDPTYSLQINCKKSQKLQVLDEQTTATYFKRDFAIYLRASNPRFFSLDESYSSVVFPSSTFDDIALMPANNGNYRAQPVYFLTGPFAELALINESNNQMFEITSPIPSGETWIFDVRRRQFYRLSDSESRFKFLSDLSERVHFESGINNIHVVASGLTSESMIESRHYHTVL